MNWWDDIPRIDLAGRTVAPALLELVPEAVARENMVVPLACDAGALQLAMADPPDLDMLQKLQFILNRDLHLVLSSREQISAAIDRLYGP